MSSPSHSFLHISSMLKMYLLVQAPFGGGQLYFPLSPGGRWFSQPVPPCSARQKYIFNPHVFPLKIEYLNKEKWERVVHLKPSYCIKIVNHDHSLAQGSLLSLVTARTTSGSSRSAVPGCFWADKEKAKWWRLALLKSL